jgi:hypothetical protein
MYPLSTRAIRSNNRCKYALEVNKGWFKENGVKVGDTVGGEGFPSLVRQAQEFIEDVEEDLLESPVPEMDPEGMADPTMPIEQPQQPEQPAMPNPDVMLNKSYKEIFEVANDRNKDLVVIYQTKDGITLPPKLVSPPYNFLPDENGKSNAIVNLWDNQTSGWKSFLLDNIIDVQEKVNYAEENVEGNMY